MREAPRLVTAQIVTAGGIHRKHKGEMSPNSLPIVRPRGVPERLAVDKRCPNTELVLGFRTHHLFVGKRRPYWLSP